MRETEERYEDMMEWAQDRRREPNLFYYRLAIAVMAAAFLALLFQRITVLHPEPEDCMKSHVSLERMLVIPSSVPKQTVSYKGSALSRCVQDEAGKAWCSVCTYRTRHPISLRCQPPTLRDQA